jgi:aconitate hydratase
MDHLFLQPSDDPEAVEVARGPNIQPLPRCLAMAETLRVEVLICLGDDITTDDILPAGPHILSLRSNIPEISKYVFSQQAPGFAKKAKEKGGGFIVAGRNYGQGSSREHAALGPMYLGIRAVIAQSFARIHRANLINFGILPVTFSRPQDLDRIQTGDQMVVEGAAGALRKGKRSLHIWNRTQNYGFDVDIALAERERNVVVAGGRLNHFRL